MNSAILGLYGVYFVLVAYRGNSSKFLDYITQEGGFVSWAIAIMILGVLYNQDKTRPFVAPLATLMVLSLILSRRADVIGQTEFVYNYLTGKRS